ncbi:hypothetical protein NKH18_45650 [Streptomyces sp. M10(2022)]
MRTPHPWLTLAGDAIRCDLPVALMERAATTGFLAANALLADRGVRGQVLWTVPGRAVPLLRAVGAIAGVAHPVDRWPATRRGEGGHRYGQPGKRPVLRSAQRRSA